MGTRDTNGTDSLVNKCPIISTNNVGQVHQSYYYIALAIDIDCLNAEFANITTSVIDMRKYM
jgi:hypothetical protein